MIVIEALPHQIGDSISSFPIRFSVGRTPSRYVRTPQILCLNRFRSLEEQEGGEEGGALLCLYT